MKEKNRGTGKQCREDMEDYGEEGTHKFMKKCIKTLDDPLLQIFSKVAFITYVTDFCAVTGIILNVPVARYQLCYKMFTTEKKRGSNG